MKPIRSKHHEEKRRKKNQKIMGIVLIIVMFGSVFSVIVFTLGTKDTNATNIMYYNGFEFTNQNGVWIVNIGNFNFIFRYNPNQVKEIEGQVNLLNNYYNKPLYIYSENQGATSEISVNIGPFTERIQFACFEDKECDENLPLKTCEYNFIIIEENNETSLTQQGGCVFIQGPSQDLVRISDEFLFKILGIRQ